jgi:hypothetical protein
MVLERDLMLTPRCVPVVVLLTFLPAVSAQEDKSLYPLKVGTKWTYKVKDQEEKFVVTAAKEEAVGDQKCMKLEARLKDRVVATEHVAVLKDGIYRFKFDERAIEPPLCFCKLPPKKGEKWEQKFKVGPKEGVARFESGEEEISVPAGKYKAVSVKGEVVEDSITIKMSFWFAPGIGMVRQVIDQGEAVIVLELESIDRPADKK